MLHLGRPAVKGDPYADVGSSRGLIGIPLAAGAGGLLYIKSGEPIGKQARCVNVGFPKLDAT